MIKGVLSQVGGEGRVTLLVGLSRMNTERLLAGEPILFSLGELGIDPSKLTDVLVMGGEDEAAMEAEIRAHTSPGSTIFEHEDGG